MNLQAPGALWWLLPLGGFIVAMYLLRMRRRDVQVPSTFLWPERVDEIRANSLFQKLKFNWLMVLQLLALALMIFGLTRIQVKQEGLAGAVTIVVLDASASMGATDIEPSRFGKGIERIEDMVGSAGATDRIALILAGPTPRVVFPLSNDQAKMRNAIRDLEVTDAPSDIGEALRLATAIVGQSEGGKIVLISDGCFDDVQNFNAGKSELVYTKIGEGVENVGVQALGVTHGPSGSQLYVGLKNFGNENSNGAVSLYADDKLIDSSKYSVEQGKTWGKTIKVPAGTQVFRASIDNKDILQADNFRAISAQAGSSIRVLLISQGDIFLEKALILDPRVILDRSDSVPATEKVGSAGLSEYDIVIFNGTEPVPVKARSILVLGKAGSISPVEVQGTVSSPIFLTSEKHPLLDGVDFGSVYVDRVEKVSPKSDGVVLAETKDGPLLVISEGRKRVVYLAFQPLDSDFPLNYSFPIFVSNVIEYLSSEEVSQISSVNTGSVVGLPATSDALLKVKHPDGDVNEVAESNGRYLVRDLVKVGQYELGEGEEKKTVLANLISNVESDVRPKESIQISGQEVAQTRVLDRFSDLWKPLALLALLVLAGEWWLYARKS